MVVKCVVCVYLQINCKHLNYSNKKWTHDLSEYMSVDLDSIIALISLMYIVESNYYELYLGDAFIIEY